MNYNSQLKAWAIDRAIETLKVAAGGALTAAAVIEVANQYCAFTDTPEPAVDADGTAGGVIQ